MRKGLFVLGLSFVPVPAIAALPPHYQRAAEFTAVINHASEALGIARPIYSIMMTEPDVYEVMGGDCRVEMYIVDAPPEVGQEAIAGPRRFVVEAGPLDCD